MGICLSAEQKQNRAIQRQMDNAETELAENISILILGTGDSGKTTLRKQLVSCHGTLFEKQSYRETFRKIILGNLMDGVLEVMAHLGRPDEISVLKDRAREVETSLPADLAGELTTLIWSEPFQNSMVENKGKIQLQDCFLFFVEEFKEYPKWGGPDWVPTADDCIRARVRTSGVVKDEVEINNVKFTLFDVGGQRAERRKWMHSFDACTASIFVTAISEYDQVLFEDRSKNRLQEAMELFYECVNSPWLDKTTMILFLNKKDRFHEKFAVQKIPLNVSGLFPSAPDNGDEEEALKWISKAFVDQKVLAVPGKKPNIYVHVTTATDPNNVKAVFAVCANIVLKRNMADAGFTN